MYAADLRAIFIRMIAKITKLLVFPLLSMNHAGGSTPKVPEDHVFAYPPVLSSRGGDSGKTQDDGDAAIFPSPMRPPSGDDFFYATRRYAEPSLDSPSPRAPGGTTQAAAAVGAAGAAAAVTRARAGSSGEGVAGSATSGDWPSPVSGSASGEWLSSAANVSGGGGGGAGGAGGSRQSSSTISALSAGSMETKHDVGSDARASSPLSPASRASGSCAPSVTVGGGGAPASAAMVVAAAAGTGAAAAGAGTTARERDGDGEIIDVRLVRLSFTT